MVLPRSALGAHIKRRLETTAALSVIQPYLESLGIYSRGRFGAWKYEIGNMDHSVQMGAEVADRLVLGSPELCWNGRILPKAEQTLRLRPERMGEAAEEGGHEGTVVAMRTDPAPRPTPSSRLVPGSSKASVSPQSVERSG